MIVSTYRGPAIVVLPDGTLFKVGAHLQSTAAPGMQMWRGVITSDNKQALWDTVTVSRATIRLPSGRDGMFAPVGLEGFAGRELRLNGHGAAPF